MAPEETMRKTIDIFFKFMWNEWNEDICTRIFGWRSEGLWNVWVNTANEHGPIAAVAVYWALLDSGCKNEICNYIEEIDYKG